MRKLIACTSLLLTTALSTHAQSRFQSGSVVTERGDTLHGFIDDQQWRRNPKKIKFRQGGEGSPTQSYGLQDITFFNIDGQDAYLRAFVKEDMNSAAVDADATEPKDSYTQDTVFLKILVLGKRLSLYALTDSKDHYYISDGQGRFDELIYKIHTVQLENGGTREDAVNEFRHQLFAYLPDQDSVSMAARIEGLPFSERPLMQVVKDLNGNSNTFVNHHAQASPTKLQLYIGAGISTSSLSFTGNDYGATPMSFNHSVGPLGEVGLDFTSNQKLGDFALRLSIAYWTASFSGKESDGQGADTYQLNMSVITPSVDVLYSFYKSQTIKVYAGLGAGMNVASYPTNTYVSTNPGIISTDKNNVHLDPATSWLNVHLRVGAKIINHFGAEVEANSTGSMTNRSYFDGKVATYSLKALYYF